MIAARIRICGNLDAAVAVEGVVPFGNIRHHIRAEALVIALILIIKVELILCVIQRKTADLSDKRVVIWFEHDLAAAVFELRHMGVRSKIGFRAGLLIEVGLARRGVDRQSFIL